MSLFYINFTDKVFEKVPAFQLNPELQKLYPAYYQDVAHIQAPSYQYPPIEERIHNQDTAFAAYHSEFETLIAHFDKLAKAVGMDMDAGLASLRNTILFAYHEDAHTSHWQNQPAAAFEELKRSLEQTLAELFQAHEKQEITHVQNTLNLLAEQFLTCPIGSALQAGEYEMHGNVLNVIRHETPGKPSLAEFVLAAPRIAYVYDGKVTELCNAFPPLQLGEISYMRRPNTFTPEIHGQHNIDQYNIFKTEFDFLLDKFNALGAHPGVDCDMMTLLTHIRLNVFFPFEVAPADRQEKLDTQDAGIFIDIKNKLEAIYVMLDKKVKSQDKALLNDVNTTLQEMVTDIVYCGPGFHELVTDVLDKEKHKQNKTIDIPRVTAQARTAAALKVAQEKIRQNPSIHAVMHTHVGRYHLKIAEKLGYNPLLDEGQRTLNDVYIAETLEDLEQFDDDNPVPFRDNHIGANPNDVTHFDRRMSRHFNEKLLISAISDALEERIRYLHAQYLKDFERQKKTENTYGAEHAAGLVNTKLTQAIQILLLEQKIDASMIDLNHMMSGLFKPNADPLAPLALSDKLQLDQSLNVYAIYILIANGQFAMTLGDDDTHYLSFSRGTIASQFECRTMILGTNRIEEPKNFVHSSFVAQHLMLVDNDSNKQICSFQSFIDRDLHMDAEKVQQFLSSLTTFASFKEVFSVLDAEIASKHEEYLEQAREVTNTNLLLLNCDRTNAPVVKKLVAQSNKDIAELEAITNQERAFIRFRASAQIFFDRLKDSENKMVLASLSLSANKGRYGEPTIEALFFETLSDLYHFLKNNFSASDINTLATHLREIPHLIGWLREGYQSDDPVKKIHADYIVRDLGAFVFDSHLLQDSRNRRLAFLASVYDTVLSHVLLDNIPNELRLHLSDKAACHYIQSIQDIAKIYRSPSSNVGHAWHFTLVNTPRALAKVLAINAQNIFLNGYVVERLTQHKNAVKLAANLAFIKNSNQHSDYDQGLFIESIQDIHLLLATDPELFIYHDNHHPLQKICQMQQFSTVFIDEYNVNALVNLAPLLTQIHTISYHSQLRYVHIDLFGPLHAQLYQDVFVPIMASDNPIPAKDFPEYLLLFIPKEQVQYVLSRCVKTYADWFLMMQRFQTYNPIPHGLFTIFFDNFDDNHLVDMDLGEDLLSSITALGDETRLALASRYVDADKGIISLFQYFKESDIAHFMKYICAAVSNIIDNHLLPNDPTEHSDAILQNILNYCDKPENLRTVMNALGPQYWPWLLGSLALVPAIHTFTWIFDNDPLVRLAALEKLLIVDPSLGKDAPPTPTRRFVLLTPTNRGDRLRALVSATDQYDAAKVIQTLTSHFVQKQQGQHFVQPDGPSSPTQTSGLHPDISF